MKAISLWICSAFLALACSHFSYCQTLSYPFVPWAVPDTYDPSNPVPIGQEMTLKVIGADSFDAFLGRGNFLALDFGEGAGTYKDSLSGDSTDPFSLSIGDYVGTKTGNMPNMTESYLQKRLDKDEVFTNDDTAWEEWLATGAEDGSYASTPRIVIFPIVQNPEGWVSGAAQDLLIVDFAGFFIESATYDKTPDLWVNVTGRFVWTFNGSDNLITIESIPEPSSLLALLCGLGGVGGAVWRRRTQRIAASSLWMVLQGF